MATSLNRSQVQSVTSLQLNKRLLSSLFLIVKDLLPKFLLSCWEKNASEIAPTISSLTKGWFIGTEPSNYVDVGDSSNSSVPAIAPSTAEEPPSTVEAIPFSLSSKV